MTRKTAQRLLIASGILVLLSGGSCFLGSGDPFPGVDAEAFISFGLGVLAFAVILGIIGLIGLIFSLDT